MSSLLPPNANAREHALDDASARLGAVPVEIAKLWNAQTCPAAFLPWLAWALSVDEWDESWDESQQRAMIAASYEVHSHKGTPYSIKAALLALGYDNVQIREGEMIFLNGEKNLDGSWHLGSDGFWPLFDIVLNIGYMPNETERQKIIERIDRYKNARSQLKNLIFTDLFLDGTWILDGSKNLNGGIF